ncbi:MAG TPA: O-antigen ligase family protein [Nevskiales bacterium]|nr:O-antigen ligase family protein [Nevskiales bacterium]
MSETGQGLRLAARLPFAALLLIVLWMPLPYGSNVPWAVALLGILTFSALALWALLSLTGQSRVPRALWANHWVLLIWLLWLGWVAGQLMPLPVPGAATATTPSIAPEKTYQHLLESFTYFGLYLLVLLTATSRQRLRLLGMAIVVSGLIQALYGSLMVLSGLEYGFFEKKTAYLGNATGTFINRNHLAGYLEICAAVGVGLVVADLKTGGARNWKTWLRDITELAFSRKFLVRAFLVVMVIALVLTRSRMGNVAFFASLAVCGLLYVLLRERRAFLKAVAVFGSFLVIDLVIVNQWFGLEKVVERIERTEATTEGRAYIFPVLMRAIETHWQAGSGLGTFSLAILPFRATMPKQHWDHAHNDYAQFLIEVGLPGALLLACLALVTTVHAFRVIASRRNRLRTGVALAALMALTALAVHSAVDFNLQIPANAATLVIVMAMVNSCSHRSRRVRDGSADDRHMPATGH